VVKKSHLQLLWGDTAMSQMNVFVVLGTQEASVTLVRIDVEYACQGEW
jgi:hypothetical protein